MQKRFSRKGSALTEYALVLFLVMVAAIGAASAMGKSVSAKVMESHGKLVDAMSGK
jgi:Flp pilus assembly pilin Flp